MKQWYEELFNNYAKSYDKESFTHDTLGECDFIEKEINYDKSKRILDVGCGTGRHAIELSKRGYNVTGIDLSDDQLNYAGEKAKAAGANPIFIKADARNFYFDQKFDLVIMICEGAFSLMETDEMNYQILKCITESLTENGKLIFTCLNALFPLYHDVKEFLSEGTMNVKSTSFNLETFRDNQSFEVVFDDGSKKTLTSNERYFAPSEITWYLKSLGYKKIDIHGCKLGAFSRFDKLTTDDFEMLVLAE